ncbi:leucine-rich repeat domain-containing protein [Flavobacterium pectinovorum]|uniref:Leucine-rich repeat domain-containing protein n=1 Tax=Flavobacterium pectinovorum TaxID=29533 RepID=A0A502ER20_9FLAO|nr:leucine-rich repeat domain-containing protein [Flavobacterium pectinovorum]TPG39947.1 leucine-rich repeat domain-containing protein [Flavobacterium pectinovorum]
MEKKWKNFSGNINIYKDLQRNDIREIFAEKNIHSLQFYEFENPKNETWEILNDFFGEYPNIGLRLLWFETQNFSFYKLIPNIRKFTIASYNTFDFSKLQINTKLNHFGIEETKSIAVDVSFIKEFIDLESLYVDGMKKGLNNIKSLTKLKKLTFRGVKLENLQFITDLKNLEDLKLLFGSYKDLDALSNLKKLKSIEFSRVRQIPDFNFLNSLENLEKIEFEGMAKMEEIPDMSKLTKLKKIIINNNLQLNDIQNISKIPNLKLLHLTFADNSKAQDRKNLINQSLEILMTSKTIKYTNIFHWIDEVSTKRLTDKGIEKWEWGKEM